MLKMSELDELVKRRGVLMAGRFGPDWKVADQKLESLFFETPGAAQVMAGFAAAIQGLLNAVGIAMRNASTTSWTPLHAWAFSSGDYTFAMYGDRFLVAETAQIKSIDELQGLLSQPSKPTS